MPLPKPSAIIFDWDGTLANTLPHIMATMNRVLAEFDTAPIALGTATNSSVTSSKELFIALLGEPRGLAAKQRYEDYLDEYYHAQQSVLGDALRMPAADTLLQTLAAQGIKCAIATNKRRKRFWHECQALGLDTAFDCTMTLDDVNNRKPHPEMIERVLQRLNVPASAHVWMVGDHHVDSESAKRAGITAIHIEQAGIGASQSHPPDLIVNDLAAVLRLLND